jgi:hypothetical protein
MTTGKRVDRILFAVVVAGFCTFDAITTGMWFSLSYQRTLERPPVLLATVALIAITIVALWLWAFRKGHPNRRPFAVAVFVTAAVAVAYQALGPSVGWWSGLAFAPPLPLQALVYGWQLTSAVALLLLAYRMLAAYRPIAALISYGIVLLLLAPATVLGERISLHQGDYTFAKGYSPVWDALWFVTLALLPLLIYETLRRRVSARAGVRAPGPGRPPSDAGGKGGYKQIFEQKILSFAGSLRAVCYNRLLFVGLFAGDARRERSNASIGIN